ncbi:MAG: class I SAM-dependent methyltransferase [Candidatus Manganitrophus sp. SA1]|nr:class I SAM-dependent methyltransferase [Candidatus Manganitrophus morganii]
MVYGCEQALIETNPVKRLAFRWLGATHLGDRSRNHYLMRALRKISLPEDANVLNAGCANGAHSFYLSERHPGWKITGIEIESEQVTRAAAIAEKKGTSNLSFHVGDLHQIRFSELFHLIFSMHVLTYLKDDLEVLKRFSRALKRGGYLILSIPTPPAPSPLPRLLQRLFQPAAPPGGPPISIERSGYSNEEITHKLNEAGFRPLSITHPAGPLWQSAWEIHTLIENKRLLRAMAHPFLLFLVDLDQWLCKEYPYPMGRDSLIIAQRTV